LGPALLSFCDALAEGGAGEAATHIRTALEQRQIDPGSLLAASLSRDQEAIRNGAVHRGLAPDLLWLIAELAVSPFVHAVQSALFSHADALLADALAAWVYGYCPACGSWPALAEAVQGQRVLRCSFCAAAWELPDYACIYCGEHGQRFRTAVPDPERKGRRLELCAACGSYLKTVEGPELSPFPLLATADLETMDLDMAAMEGGFQRPPLNQFRK
jgi:FdhE protein